MSTRAGGAAGGDEPGGKGISNGTLFVCALVGVFLLGWFLYRTTIPPTWLRDFGVDIALRATPDPNAPTPEDSRQVTPRGLADSPFICAANIIPVAWDQFVVVTSAPEVLSHPALAAADWAGQQHMFRNTGTPKSADDLADELARDARYQAIVLIKDNKVVGAELFYTFWADLTALTRPDGFTPANAIFTAAVKNGAYVLSVPAPEDIPPAACRPKTD